MRKCCHRGLDVCAGSREQQLVVLAAVERQLEPVVWVRVPQEVVCGDAAGFHDCANTAGLAHLGEIVHKAVADVHRGLHAAADQRVAGVKPGNGPVEGRQQVEPGLVLRQSTLEERLEAAGRAAEWACDSDAVTGLGRPARERWIACRASHGHGHEVDRRAHDVTPGYAAAVGAAGGEHSPVQLTHVLHRGVESQPKRHQCVEGASAHRGDVAEVDRQGLPAQVLPGREVVAEVHAFNERVGGGKLGGLRRAPRGRVVAYAEQQPEVVIAGILLTLADQFLNRPDEAELANVTYHRSPHYIVTLSGQQVKCAILGAEAGGVEHRESGRSIRHTQQPRGAVRGIGRRRRP